MMRSPLVVIACVAPLLIASATVAVSTLGGAGGASGRDQATVGAPALRGLRSAVEDHLRAGRPRDARAVIDAAAALGSIQGGRLYDRAGRRTYESELLRGTIFDDGVLPPETFSALAPEGAELRATMPGTLRHVMPLRSADGGLLGALEIVRAAGGDESATLSGSRRWLPALGVAVASSVLLLVGGGIASRAFPDAGRPPEPAPGAKAAVASQRADQAARLDELQRSLRRAQEEKARAERKLARAERLANVGQVAAGLAHEVGAPLCVIRGHAERLLSRTAGSEDVQQELRIVAQQIDRITNIVSEVLAFARVPPPRLGPTHLPDVVHRIVTLTSRRCADQGVRVIVSPCGNIPEITADASQAEQVLLNLVTNALDAMPRGGVLTLTVTATSAFDPEGTAKARPHVAISVEDTGCGIPAEDLPHIFEPFFSAKHASAQPGTGLGLAIAEAIMREHRGWMQVHSELGKGTRMTAYFPVASPTAAEDGNGGAGARSVA